MTCKPNRKEKRKNHSTNKTHLLFFIILAVIITNKIHQRNKIKPKEISSNLSTKYQNLGILLIAELFRKNKKLMKCDKAYLAVKLLLILLSNDVHQNPGPKPTTTKNVENCCSMCTKEISAENEDLLKCQTCQQIIHVNCLPNQQYPLQLDRSFEWVCPNRDCNPNHEESRSTFNQLSPNRYNVPYPIQLDNDADPIQLGNDAEPLVEQMVNNNPDTLSGNYDMSIMKELNRIKYKAYQGKHLCRGCYKEVKELDSAISCDICEMWTHRSCSDISIRLYNELKYKSNFPWTCNKCRKDEDMNHDRIDPTKLPEKDQPDNISKAKSSKNELTILAINCRSLCNKFEELLQIIMETDADILCLTETWFDDSIPSHGFVPEGYRIIRKDRSNDFKQKYGRNKGGGIAVIYKAHLKIIKKDYLTDDIEEILWVQVRGKENFLIGTIYRPEYTDVMKEENGESKIEENIRKACEISENLIITGDFNIDYSDNDSRLTKQLKVTYSAYNLHQYVQKPTRIDKKSGKPTIIDHVWAPSDNHLINHVNTCIGISDHLAIYIKLKLQKQKVEEKTIKHRNYRNYDSELYRQSLQVNLAQRRVYHHINNKDVNAATEELMLAIKNAADEWAPMTEIKISEKTNYVPWFTKELKNTISFRNDLLKDYYYYGLKSLKSRVTFLSNKINHMKRNMKKKYIAEKLREYKDNPKKCWKIINMVTNRTKLKESIEPEDITQDKANSYNNYFATIGEKIQQKLNVNTQAKNFSGLRGFSFRPETATAINKLIANIRKDAAIGYDEVGAKLIKDASDVLSPIVADIINIGYETATFPDCMKKATIKALHKKDDPDEISNYRPISILPTMSKIFERAATNQLVNHLEINKLLSRHQHAYRKGHSTQTCLVEVTNHMYKLIDQKKYVAIASLDLSKAFDSINHTLMLNKLSELGLSENTLLWIKSYLENRRQKTKFKHHTSAEDPVTSGVPQGSIIGPLLFLCFTNDIAEVFSNKCKILSYADDTQLLLEATSLPSLIKKIEDIITTAQKWYTDNTMKNNIGKTEVLIINTRKENLTNVRIKVKDDGKPIFIKPKSHIKVLGIFIDDQLDWSKQVQNVKTKSLNSIRNLHRVNHLLPIKLKVNLYSALVTPLFDYADVVWGGCGKTNSQKLQVAQNFAAKSITGNRKYDSASQSMKKLNFLNLSQRRIIHEAVFTHKSLLQQNPENTNIDYFKQQPTSNTRNSARGKLNLPVHRTTKFQNSPLFRTIKAWNSCPDHLSKDTIKIHKTQHQKLLIENTYKH